MTAQKEIVEIYVCLLDEAIDVWRPVQAERIGEASYRILSENPDPEDEHWEFSTGELVRCVPKHFHGGKNGLVAVERLEPRPSPSA